MLPSHHLSASASSGGCVRKSRCTCLSVVLSILNLDDKVPDHSTFSVDRDGRFRNSDLLRQVFEAVVWACMDAGLVRGEGFAVDASVMEADASRYHGKPPGEIDLGPAQRQTRAAAEFPAASEDENPEANRKLPKAISPSDPCAAWTAKANSGSSRSAARFRASLVCHPASIEIDQFDDE